MVVGDRQRGCDTTKRKLGGTARRRGTEEASLVFVPENPGPEIDDARASQCA